MNTLIFSDTHLGNKFDFKKYLYLSSIIERADRVIINGDFWDAYICSFDEFIHSKWSQLFPLLKAKHAVYLYGNHDERIWSDTRVNLFSDIQNDSQLLTVGDNQLFVEHGHRIVPIFPRAGRVVQKIKPVSSTFHYWDTIGFRLFQKKFSATKKRTHQKLKQWAIQNLSSSQMLVCGHSHCAEYDREYRFVNSGFIGHGLGQWVSVQGDTIKLIDERY